MIKLKINRLVYLFLMTGLNNEEWIIIFGSIIITILIIIIIKLSYDSKKNNFGDVSQTINDKMRLI